MGDIRKTGTNKGLFGTVKKVFDFAPDTALSLSVVVLCCLFFQDGADEAGLERYQLAKGMGREYVVKAGSMGSNIFWWYGDGSSYRR